MMIIYPAIDLIDGKCVRLAQGDYSKMTVYSDDPLKMALEFKAQGAEYIHIVDLDSARGKDSSELGDWSKGKGNSEIIKEIAKKTGLKVQTGGGVRSMSKISDYLDNGVDKVILGTSAVRNPDLVKEAVCKYGEKIIVGIDAKDGFVAISGWEDKSEYKAVEFALMMQDIGVKNIIYTDISRDGMLTGPNLPAMKTMADALKINVTASGGVSRLQDIIDLRKIGVYGVITGKAIYTNNLNLKEALLCQQ